MIREKQFRVSRQRQKILELLQKSKEHPSADWIYKNIRESFPSISLGTVYRNLGVLNEQGFINKIIHAGSADRFDADMTGHSHFYCDKCGEIYDVFEEASVNTVNGSSDEHRITRQTTSYYGICRKCIKNNQQ